jgi:hypothetical protein
MKERRRTRIHTAKEVTLSGMDGSMRGVIDNVSLKGCLLQVAHDRGFAEGTGVELAIHLEKGNPEFDIKVKGVIVRREESVVAVDFTEVTPEGFHHLLRFVQYNADDPEAIEKELGKTAYREE